MFAFSHTQSPLRDAITAAYRLDETLAVKNLAATLDFSQESKNRIDDLARKLIGAVRADRSKSSGVDALMHEFSLSSEEGIALMCLAEALLRIPDNATRDKLIKDKMAGGDWKSHVGNSPSMFVNAAAWGLVLTGKLSAKTDEKTLGAALTRVIQKGGEPFIRGGVNYAMKMLGKQFVTGQTIGEALSNGKDREKLGYRFSFDMLGEAAMTAADADRYYQDYVTAIHAIGKDSGARDVYDSNGISVKLSAIHPRYFRAQHERVMSELLPRLKALFMLAKEYNIGLNIDAEEANRLELSLDLMEALVSDPDLAGFHGIGFVVQAYQKRCPYVIDYLIDLARRNNQKLMIRLVKGAYWDSEIKWAQVDGMDGYPVYTRKVHTDVSYLACAQKLLAAQDVIFPQFATHNAQSLSTIYEMGKDKDFEFQCLHGMGETLYDQVVGEKNLGRRVRIYAPVGTHKTLLAYLVRRLLENGANSSFVNRIVDENVSIDELVVSPLDSIDVNNITPNPLTPNPSHIYANNRLNSRGIDLSNEHVLAALEADMSAASHIEFNVQSITHYPAAHSPAHAVLNPADHSDVVGHVAFIKPEAVADTISTAIAAQTSWQQTTPSQRAAILRKFADTLESQKHMALLMMMAGREAGKTLPNAIAEVREAVDFCRYYADETERLNLSAPLGTVVAISPWNFPLAIFVGEVVSALAAGNTVVAKPAEQTSLIAHLAVSWLHEAGVPTDVLQLVLGAGDVGAALTADTRINGVIFTGSTDVAKRINTLLAKREDNPVLIAETGGMNAMIVDSTALAEQVCTDVLASAFDSAGQRCSALRILCVQEDVADHMVEMIKGAMDELVVNNPALLATDVGPVIDKEAQDNLNNHINALKQIAPYHEVAIKSTAASSTFVAPIMFELKDLSQLKKEVFGPVLHVVRFAAHELDDLIDNINSKGFALTHGIHSRIDGTIAHICDRIEAGNVYINRNIVGAVVGVQPFGGHAMSGTGPKAGGPFYLQRLSTLDAWDLPVLDYPARVDEVSLKAVLDMANEMGLSDAELSDLQACADTARQNSLNHARSTLAGPTGEANTLSWHAPKAVTLYGGNLAKATNALAVLAANGVQAHVTPEHPLAIWAEHFDDVLQVKEQQGVDANDIIVALSAMPSAEQERLAGLDGAIRRVIHAENGLDMARLYHEVSRSHNTTAAGGNASLMASA
ncbi:bifunctional proline dehydrogenase/L-glutamate gamma-semialdehyde dehydrogenase [Moraxella caviae]|uniref:Bifunctional protein PutA n=1 Tax=Moraxella caviae TaxID=34060 RepID=A0A1T0A2S9_9GAMM|nr:bifunctional proline dehydrogenase/L-glutamate gamma-semialdehyde dehydrogenase PutA [Moraxella caviae]OOR90102.1 bifunctional proline dehydrogenase/L-glutamate gamma-semialdehyde dehydrogenase [Moraxella caviae]STZ14725.1 Bifunctional protein putA [Moraxella caviae]VEW14038.1 Bifunctional protein putA [Moraxella caviae]